MPRYQPRPLPRHARSPPNNRLAPLLRPGRHPHHHQRARHLHHPHHRHRPRRPSRHLPHPRHAHQPRPPPRRSLRRRPQRAALPRPAHARHHPARDLQTILAPPRPGRRRRRRRRRQVLPAHDGLSLPHPRTCPLPLRLSLAPHPRRLPLLALRQQSLRTPQRLSRLRPHPHPIHPSGTKLSPPIPAPQLARRRLETSRLPLPPPLPPRNPGSPIRVFRLPRPLSPTPAARGRCCCGDDAEE